MLAERSYTVKKILTYITILLSTGHSQFDLYPVTDFFGGGIGYSPMSVSYTHLTLPTILLV